MEMVPIWGSGSLSDEVCLGARWTLARLHIYVAQTRGIYNITHCIGNKLWSIVEFRSVNVNNNMEAEPLQEQPKNFCLIAIGMAGSGKTTFIGVHSIL